jgi:hypothetical protein
VTMTPLETAWLAGLLEGEGSFSCTIANKHRPLSRRMVVQLGMTDEDIVRRAGELMDAPAVHVHKRRHGRKQCFSIIISGFKAERVMKAILPHMGDRRRDAILRALAEWQTRPVMLRERGKMADCHPDRPNKGRGLCDECHRHERYLKQDLPMRQAVRASAHRDFLFV